MQQNTFKGLTALVTGASSGIGYDIALELAARGVRLVLLARRQERLQALANTITGLYSVDVFVCPVDLFSIGAIDIIDEFLQSHALTIDILINNAGYGVAGDFMDLSRSDLRGQVQLNITALNELTHYVLPTMRTKKRGYILLVASTASFQPIPHFALYAATKFFVRGLGESLHYEVKKHGIGVTVLSPGPTQTEFIAKGNLLIPKAAQGLVMSSQQVAKEAITGLLAKKRHVVPGIFNKIGFHMVRFLPTAWVAKVAGLIFLRSRS